MNTPLTESRSPAAAAISPAEGRWIAGLCFVLLGLRVLYAFNMNFNSDEAQHLHVVWAWTAGKLQYRDVFDNHTPLFHILCAPVMRLFGETAMVMIYMRLAMIPLFAASLFFAGKIGACLFSRRAGIWAAVFIGFAPFFFLKTVEFRTDDLWTAAWLGSVAILVGGRLSPWRMFCAGMALGATFAVSMKTTLLAIALLLAGLVVAVLWRRAGGALKAGAVLRGAGAGIAGLLIVPAAIVAFFAAHHALDSLYYGVIGHNLLPARGHSSGVASRVFWFPATLPFFIVAAHFIFRCAKDRTLAMRRALVLLTAGFFIALLHSYWPMITNQDYPPVTPLFVVLLTPGVLALADSLRAAFPRVPRLAVPLGLAVFEMLSTLYLVRPKPRTRGQLEYLADVLHFTDKDDYVMDAKSGAIFRQRPFYYALENVTRARMGLGSSEGRIADTIIADLVKTRTCMASEDRLEGRDLAFVRANYLPFDRGMRVAGQRLKIDQASGRAAFEIQIPAIYAIITPRGAAVGTLDGKPYLGKILLAAGPHEFTGSDPSQPHLLVWAQALERGYRPSFSPEAKETAEKKKRR